MGEIANDMINGFGCSWCGIYFEEEHGYPVACEDCWNGELKSRGCNSRELTSETGVQKAFLKEA